MHVARRPPRTLARLSIAGVLWAGALALTGYLGYERYRPAAHGRAGVDFGYFIRAAQNLSAGRSPYANLHEYVYPPTIALVLEPFVHTTRHDVWRVWVAVIVAAPVVAAAVFVASRAPKLRSWLWPLLFAACTFTVLFDHFWPVGRDLYLGQTDTMTLPLLVLSAFAASRGAAGLRGMWVGGAALLKAWPAAFGLAFFQRGLPRRWRSILVLVGTSLIAPLMALAVAGKSGLVGFVRNAFDAHEQKTLINDSVWAIPQLLFAHSGLAAPVHVSSLLRYGVSAVLACWVVALLLLALRTRGDAVLCTFNVTFCILMLLPIAHRQYAVFVLPLLWFWLADLLRGGRVDPRRVAVLLVMLGWWVVQSVTWPYTGSSPAITAYRFAVPFTADLVACTASVVGGIFLWRAERKAAALVPRAPAAPPEEVVPAPAPAPA